MLLCLVVGHYVLGVFCICVCGVLLVGGRRHRCVFGLVVYGVLFFGLWWLWCGVRFVVVVWFVHE